MYLPLVLTFYRCKTDPAKAEKINYFYLQPYSLATVPTVRTGSKQPQDELHIVRNTAFNISV